MLAFGAEVEVEQRSDEWFAIRRPLVTSSRLNDVLARPTKQGEEAAARRNYRTEIVLATLTGKTPSRYTTKAMEWGTETEELAATMYALRTSNTIRVPGIFVHKFMKLGDTPDLMISESGGKSGVGEIKCFNSSNHLLALRSGHMPKEYKAQVQNHMYMTGSEWCDFISFDPDFPPHAQLFIERIYRDEAYIKSMVLAVSVFLDEVEEDIKFLNNYKG